MYEDLDSLPHGPTLLRDLKPVSSYGLSVIRERWPKLPEDFLSFLSERGVGPMEEGFHFVFLDRPMDAATEIYGTQKLWGEKIEGSIAVFGTDHLGDTYGFDTQNRLQLLRISDDGEVRRIPGEFCDFVRSLIAEYPQIRPHA